MDRKALVSFVSHLLMAITDSERQTRDYIKTTTGDTNSIYTTSESGPNTTSLDNTTGTEKKGFSPLMVVVIVIVCVITTVLFVTLVLAVFRPLNNSRGIH